MRMSGTYAASDLPTPRYLDLAKKLYTPLLLGDNSVLLFYPMNGTDYDVINMWEREEDRAFVLGNQRGRFEFANLTLANPDTIGENIWIEQLQHALKLDMYGKTDFMRFSDEIREFVKEGKEPVFFVNIPDSFSDDRLRAFFDLATRIHFISRHRIHFLLTMDSRWNHCYFLELTKDYTTLFEHVSYVPAAPTEEIRHFVQHFTFEWNYPVSKSVVELLIEEAGGSLVFPKYALRMIIKEKLSKLSDVRRALQSHPEYLRLIQMFLNRITPLQNDILTEIANNQPFPDEEEAQHMMKLDMIRRNGNGYIIRSPSIARFLKGEEKQLSVRETIQASDLFSKRERSVLLALLDASGQSVSRETLATILWGEHTQEKYSDWSIDQVMSRVRKKMKKDSVLCVYSIVAHKRKGFSLPK